MNDAENRFSLHDIVVVDIKFWILIMLATTIGEILGNFISRDLNLGYVIGSTILLSSFFSTIALAIVLQKQHHLIFWILVILGNVSGTDIADFITRSLRLGNIYGSMLVFSILCVLLLILSFIKTKKDKVKNSQTFIEVIFWLAILTSGSLGTTFGDFLSSDTPFGSAGGTTLMLGILTLLGLLALKTNFSKTFLYWMAIISVHIIGATFGNYISKPEGLNLGNVVTGIILLISFGTYLVAPGKPYKPCK